MAIVMKDNNIAITFSFRVAYVDFILKFRLYSDSHLIIINSRLKRVWFKNQKTK